MMGFEGIYTMALLLVAAHYLCDFPLQGDFMANQKGKNVMILFGHASIHAAAVLLITGMMTVALLELAFHFLIDRDKCRGRISAFTDQALHLFCKAAWLMLWYATNGL